MYQKRREARTSVLLMYTAGRCCREKARVSAWKAATLAVAVSLLRSQGLTVSLQQILRSQRLRTTYISNMLTLFLGGLSSGRLELSIVHIFKSPPDFYECHWASLQSACLEKLSLICH
jgi:hypothetical protein